VPVKVVVITVVLIGRKCFVELTCKSLCWCVQLEDEKALVAAEVGELKQRLFTTFSYYFFTCDKPDMSMKRRRCWDFCGFCEHIELWFDDWL